MAEEFGAVEPHGELVAVDPSLHYVEGKWGPLKRKMTVIVLDNGKLIIHSAMRLEEEAMKKIDGLGAVSYIVVPNIYHNSEAPWYARQYPRAQVFVPTAVISKEAKRMRVTGSSENNWPREIRNEVEREGIKGVRFGETVLFHRKTKTLILTDLAFNFDHHFKGALHWLMTLNKVDTGFKPTRLFERYLLKDKKGFAESLKRIQAWDFQRVIVSHGENLEAGAKEIFIQTFQKFAT